MACLLLVAIATSGCTGRAASLGSRSPGPPSGAGPRVTVTGGSDALPTAASVRDGRFVRAAVLDGGGFRVDPAPASMRPMFRESQAGPEIWASPAVQGSRSGSVLGFGLVTTGRAGPDVAPVSKMPAWVGFAWGGVYHCPAEIVSRSPSPIPELPSNGYEAVVIGTDDGTPAFTYTARSSPCGGPILPARIALATHVVSIPWRLVRIGARPAVRFTLPPCGIEFGLAANGNGAHATIEVDAVVPDVAAPCPSPVPKTESFDLGPPGAPPAPGNPGILHAPLGIVRQIQL